MGSKGKGPILNVIWTATNSPSGLWTNAINFWAWTSWNLVSGDSSTWTRRVAGGASLSWGVPLRPSWNPRLRWALNPNLGLCRLSWGHVASVWAGRYLMIVPIGEWAWINGVWVYGADASNIGWAWSCNHIHFYGLLRHVICGCWRCRSWSHVKGLTWSHVPHIVRLWWHPTLQPVPTPFFLYSYIILTLRLSQQILLLLLLLLTKWFSTMFTYSLLN